MYLVAIAWAYVVLMMAAAEALTPQGTLFGAFVTLMLYGALPLGILMYIFGTPGRRRRRVAAESIEAAEAAEAAAATETAQAAQAVSAQADAGSHAPTGPAQGLTPEREKT